MVLLPTRTNVVNIQEYGDGAFELETCIEYLGCGKWTSMAFAGVGHGPFRSRSHKMGNKRDAGWCVGCNEGLGSPTRES